jgi:hypothetical protein
LLFEEFGGIIANISYSFVDFPHCHLAIRADTLRNRILTHSSPVVKLLSLRRALIDSACGQPFMLLTRKQPQFPRILLPVFCALYMLTSHWAQSVRENFVWLVARAVGLVADHQPVLFFPWGQMPE